MSIRNAVLPLRLIFWGGLLCVLDITFSSYSSVNSGSPTGFRFDILNDFVGMILVTIGIRKLLAFDVNQSWRSTMKFIFAVALVGCAQAFFAHFVFRLPDFVGFMTNVFGLVKLAAVFLFCNCMYQLSDTYSMRRSSVSWLKTRMLVALVWCVPLGLLNLIGLLSWVTGQNFNLNVGPLIFLLMLIFVIPLVHLFMSTSRMKRESLML